MPDLWFVLGLAIGMVLMGFCTIGSFDRGTDSVRSARPSRQPLWNALHSKQASAGRECIVIRENALMPIVL